MVVGIEAKVECLSIVIWIVEQWNVLHNENKVYKQKRRSSIDKQMAKKKWQCNVELSKKSERERNNL